MSNQLPRCMVYDDPAILDPHSADLEFTVEFDSGNDRSPPMNWPMPPFKVGETAHFKTTSYNRTTLNGELWTLYIQPDGTKKFEPQANGSGGRQTCRTTWKIRAGDNGKVFRFVLICVVWDEVTHRPRFIEARAVCMTLEVLE